MKAYIKPDLVFENFQLDSAVASGCAWDLLHAPDECVALDDTLDPEGIGPGSGLTRFNDVNCNITDDVVLQWCSTNAMAQWKILYS